MNTLWDDVAEKDFQQFLKKNDNSHLDRPVFNIDDDHEWILKEATRRHEDKKNRNSSRQLTDVERAINTHYMGLVGEYAFSRLTGLPIDTSERPFGDNGVDFTLKTKHGSFTVDVKTSSRGEWLFVNHIRADIYVLAWHRDKNTVSLTGWEWAKTVRAMEPAIYHKKGIPTHCLKKLRPIQELVSQMEKS